MKVLASLPRNYLRLFFLSGSLTLLPLLFEFSQFQISVAVFILFWALLGTAWNIMGGYAGQFSFGHGAYFGLGAYSSIVILEKFSISPWIGMLAGAVLAGLFEQLRSPGPVLPIAYPDQDSLGPIRLPWR